MSSDPTRPDAPTANGKGLPSAAELEALASLLRADVPDSENADVDLDAFMKQLDGVGDAAIQIEGRLDVLLEQLDGLVEGLEASQPSNQQVEGDSSKGALLEVQTSTSSTVTVLTETKKAANE